MTYSITFTDDRRQPKTIIADHYEFEEQFCTFYDDSDGIISEIQMDYILSIDRTQ